MDKSSIARIRINVLTKEKERIDKELKKCEEILKEDRKKKHLL